MKSIYINENDKVNIINLKKNEDRDKEGDEIGERNKDKNRKRERERARTRELDEGGSTEGKDRSEEHTSELQSRP